MSFVLQKVSKNFTFGTKMQHLTVLSIYQDLSFQKQLPYLKTTHSNWSKCNVSSKKKTLTFRTKMLYLSIFRIKLEKTIAIFEIITLKFVKTQSLVQK